MKLKRNPSAMRSKLSRPKKFTRLKRMRKLRLKVQSMWRSNKLSLMGKEDEGVAGTGSPKMTFSKDTKTITEVTEVVIAVTEATEAAIIRPKMKVKQVKPSNTKEVVTTGVAEGKGEGTEVISRVRRTHSLEIADTEAVSKVIKMVTTSKL